MNARERAAQWEEIRAERAAARAELAGTMSALADRARDPLRLKEKIARHPVLTAGIAAGVGAVLVNALLPPAPAPRERRGEAPGRPPRDPGPSPFDALRDVALRVASPWIARWVSEKLDGGNGRGEP